MDGHGDLFESSENLHVLKALVAERQGLVDVRRSLKCRIEAHAWRKRSPNGDGGVPTTFERTLAFVCKQIKEVESTIVSTQTADQKLLRSIPGIGLTCAAALVSDIQDISKFSSHKKLVAYLGLDPRVHQSGSSVHGKGYMSKRGNKRLRTLLFNGVLVAKRWIPELENYYQKKLSEGHHHFSALCATERKFVHIIYAVWSRGTPFEQRI
jgi:transposase